MSMSRKDFEAIAMIINEIRKGWNDQQHELVGTVLDDVTYDLAEYLRTTNPLFDDTRFKRAAGMGAMVHD